MDLHKNELRVHIGQQWIDFSLRTYVMGVVNVTPDSFSDGGRYYSTESAVEHGLAMAEQGADIIDIGGESTRPGAGAVSTQEEIDRVVPVIEQIKRHSSVIVSVDTYKSKTAKYAVQAGAGIINDISGLNFDADMARTAAELSVPVIAMHIKGTPKDMQKNPVYTDLIHEIMEYLRNSIEKAVAAGIPKENVIIDPGIGFGKSVADNYYIINRLQEFASLGRPLLIGVSRKSFIGKLVNVPARERLPGSAAAASAAILNGANIIRVHDVPEMKQAAAVADAVKNPGTVGIRKGE